MTGLQEAFGVVRHPSRRLKFLNGPACSFSLHAQDRCLVMLMHKYVVASNV